MRLLLVVFTMVAMMLAGCSSSDVPKADSSKTASAAKSPAVDKSSSAPGKSDAATAADARKSEDAAAPGTKVGSSPSAVAKTPPPTSPGKSDSGKATGSGGTSAAKAEKDPVPKSSAIDTPGGGIPKSGDLKAPLNPTVPQNPVAAAMTKAQQLANAGDPAGALKALKETYDADPKLRQLLVPMIELSQAYAMDFVNKKQETDAFPIFMESAQFARKLKEAGGQTLREKRSIANALYNEACVYTKTSKNDEALKSLEESIEQGLDDLKLLDTDTDMDPLRETEKFKELRA